MKKTRIEEMLQQCLDGYEAGLTPEECLSAYPGSRAELEPLLRQALSLRVAFATSPSDEFRFRMRERLMFAAGRDVKLALASEPDPDFVSQQRSRFLNLAGAACQEALRDVPPPRLAFWVNARRRLLEAASNTAPAPSRRFGTALRYSLSAAVVVVAVALAALAPFGGSNTDEVDALTALEREISRVEERTLQGQPVSEVELQNIFELTSRVTDSLTQSPNLELAEKVGGLIERAKVISPDDTALTAAEQRLQSTLNASPTAAAAVVEPTNQEPVVIPTAEPEEPEPTPTPAPLESGEVRLTETDDNTYGETWQLVTTANISFLIPESWTLLAVAEDEDGVLRQTGNFLAFQTDSEPPIIVIVTDHGQALAQVNGVQVEFRGPGVDGATIAPETLATLDEVGLLLHNFVLSIDTTPNP